MIVTCDSCGTRFKVDEQRLKKPVTKVRCSRCKHVFTVKLEAGPKEETVVLEVPEFAATRDEESISRREEADEVAEKTVASREISRPSVRSRREPSVTGQRPPVARSKIFVLTALPLFLIAVGIAYYLMTKPGTEEENKATKRITPVEIARKTEAFFIENVKAGQMLVVQGEIRNVSSYPISFVTLEAKLLGVDGKVVASQRFFAGNVLSRDELTQLSIKEIMDRLSRREGDNLSNVHIKPGQTVPFMAVFYDLPPIEELTDYSISYVNAEIKKPGR